MNEREEETLSVGDRVEGKLPRQLYCGFGFYEYAIVVSLHPFTLVSPQGDMLWNHKSPEGVKRVGDSEPREFKAAMMRWEHEKSIRAKAEQSELADLRQQLAEARQGFSAKLMTQCHDEIARLEEVNASQAAELERLRAEYEWLRAESAAFEKLASDYQDVRARLDGEIDRLREMCEAAEELVNMVGGNCSWQEVFTVIDGRLRAALIDGKEGG